MKIMERWSRERLKMLALKMGVAWPVKPRNASSHWKRQKLIEGADWSPELLEGAWPCQHLNFGLGH